jgi:alpha-tubulin suppressor-like RCC1 family protein
VQGISNVIAVAAGDTHTIAVTSDKRVWTWGDNTFGELGRSTGTSTYDPSPAPVTNLANVVAIAGGVGFTLAVTSNGQAYAWGDNTYGELGTNGPTEFDTPHLVAGISNVVWVSAPVEGDGSHQDYNDYGGTHIVAMTVDQGTNHYYGWGDTDAGEVGNGVSGFSAGVFLQATNQYTPAQVQFCTRCQREIQLGTNGSFTAQCTGTLYLYFNDEIGLFDDDAGSFTVTINGVTTNVVALDPTGYGIGVAVGTVTNGGVYPYTASGTCLYVGTEPGTASDPNGNDTNGVPRDCSDFSIINITNAVCPAAQCFSLVGKIQ